MRGNHARDIGKGAAVTRITIDADTRSKLLNLTEPLEFCDEEGRVLGRFTPVVDLSEWEPITPEVSEEELDRREQSNEKRYTTAEVLKRLKEL